jgi:hypothetical protein
MLRIAPLPSMRVSGSKDVDHLALSIATSREDHVGPASDRLRGKLRNTTRAAPRLENHESACPHTRPSESARAREIAAMIGDHAS